MNGMTEQAQPFFERDRLCRTLGIELVFIRPGEAAVRMTVKEEHLNFMGACHGGVIFSLADTAFGVAANSHGSMAVGIAAHVEWSVAVHAGDVLTATAVETHRSKRLGTYRVDIARQDGRRVASFTGTVFVTGKPVEEGSVG